MYRFALDMLSFQTFAFVVVYLARFIHGIRDAVPDDDYDDDGDFGSRTRQRERSDWCRRLWIVAMATNFWLVYFLAVADKWQHQRETMVWSLGTVTQVVVWAVPVDVVVVTVPGDVTVFTTTITRINSVPITDFSTSSPLPLLNVHS